MGRRMANRTLTRAEIPEWEARVLRHRKKMEAEEAAGAARVARMMAETALREWYRRGFASADSAIPRMQREENLRMVSSTPGWSGGEKKGEDYVMLDMLATGTLRPIALTRDYGNESRGRLTYRQLHRQIRSGLGIDLKVSMRLRCYRPWCRYMLQMPIPECQALPASDAQCTHLVGTTLLCYLYVHLAGAGGADEE